MYKVKNQNDRRYIRTETNIRQAIHKLYKQHVANLRVRDICRQANIKPPTFYRHYRNLGHAIDQVEQSLIQQFQSTIPKLQKHSASTHDYFVALLDFISKNQSYFSTANEHNNYRLLKQLLDFILPSLKFKPNYNSDINGRLSNSYYGAVIGVIYFWCQQTNFDSDQINHYSVILSDLTNLFQHQGKIFV